MELILLNEDLEDHPIWLSDTSNLDLKHWAMYVVDTKETTTKSTLEDLLADIE